VPVMCDFHTIIGQVKAASGIGLHAIGGPSRNFGFGEKGGRCPLTETNLDAELRAPCRLETAAGR
jgi:hypothetical protein